MKGKRLLVNTLFLTVISLILRSIGLSFQVFLSNKLGAAGIGLFQLVMSVNSFGATLAISGIRFTATRLVSEEMGKGRLGNIPRVMRRCLIYAFLFGFLASGAMYVSSEFVAGKFIGDARMILSLKLLSISLPFLSAGAALSGYFTGMCKVVKPAIASISEQICRIVFAIIFLSKIPSWDVERMCAAVVLGGAFGEIISFVIVYILYVTDKAGRGDTKHKSKGLTKRMLGIAMPLALSAYARVALTTVQNILVPNGLKRSGASSEEALSGYGMIQGMVFPVITFPAVLFSSVSELIVPELTEEQVRGRNDRISAAANMLLKMCFMFSVGVMGVFICFSDALGNVIYSDKAVGNYIKILAFLMPLMYMDSVTDGMLRGLGQHMYCMRLNIVDSLLSSALIFFLLPKFAIYGYIFILYASEIFNFFFSMRRLSHITKISQSAKSMALSLAAVFCAVNLSEVFSNYLFSAATAGTLAVEIIVYAAIYVFMLLVFRALTSADIKQIKSVVK